MAAKTDGETNACTFLWKIENVSHCWLKEEERIQSPTFIAEALKNTKWALWVYPSGRHFSEDSVGLYLYREEDCTGPDVIEVNYKLAFVDKAGSSLKEEILNYSCQKGKSGYLFVEERRKVFVTDSEAFLSDDTLTVQCTIWKKDETPVKPKELFARTIWNVKRRCFIWKIDKFSTLKPNIRNKFKNYSLDFDLVLKEELYSKKQLVIDGILIDTSIKYILFKIAIVNSEGKKEHYGSHEYFEADLKNKIFSTLISTRMLIENKNRYLPNDILSLDCEYIYSTGTIADQFFSHGIISPSETYVAVEKRIDNCIGKEKPQHSLVLVNDLKSIYDDGLFSDTELRTSTKTFPAHKLILSARSPVFRRMFSNDMKENNCGRIHIDDLEDVTVHRMLLYMYTDSLEDFQLENACKLYVAADKYEILSLRSSCSSFLRENLCLNTACDILVLADRHQDEDLKSAVQDFILVHDEIFGSQEWKDLMTTNIQIAADIMYQKIYRG